MRPTTINALRPIERFRDILEALRQVTQISVQIDAGYGTTMVNIGTLMLQKPAIVWDDDTLRTAESELARAVGPMAKLIVRRAAAQTGNRMELCSILSDSIADPEIRRKFVETFNRMGSGVRTGASGISGVRGTTGASVSTPGRSRTGAPATLPDALHVSSTATQGAALVPAFVDQVTARLAVYLGPIAPIVTRKAAREATSRSDFLRRVSDNLGTQDRAAFLKEVGVGDD